MLLKDVMLEKTFESPLDCMEIKPVNPKGNQSWIFTGRTDAEAETPLLWLPDAKNWLIWKVKNWLLASFLMLGKIEGRRRREWQDEMVGWHHWLSGVNSGSWWWTGRPSVLRSMESQRVGHDWAAEIKWTPRRSCIIHLSWAAHIYEAWRCAQLIFTPVVLTGTRCEQRRSRFLLSLLDRMIKEIGYFYEKIKEVTWK